MLAKHPAICYNGSMNNLVKQLDEIIGTIDFAAIWPGFAPVGFALYDDETVYLCDKEMPRDARFSGNTAIMLDDVPLAIWHVENPEKADIPRLVTGLVHEMFHAFQQEQGETRWPDEFALLTYPQDVDNFRLKLAENHYLAKAIVDNSAIDLQQFIVLREARRRIIGDAMLQEQYAETTEGMAEYAGLAALLQISREQFMKEIQAHMEVLRNPRFLFDVRFVSYSVGCLICFALKSLDINFDHDLSDKRTIYGLIPRETNDVDKFFADVQRSKQAKFDAFLAKHGERVEHNAEITGYDPWDWEKLGDRILCPSFVELGELYIKGPVMLEMVAGSSREIIAYIK